MTAIEWIAAQERVQLERAINFFGGNKGLAEMLGEKQTTVGQWVSRGKISATAAARLEQLLPQHFTAADMRPDVKTWYHKTQGGSK